MAQGCSTSLTASSSPWLTRIPSLVFPGVAERDVVVRYTKVEFVDFSTTLGDTTEAGRVIADMVFETTVLFTQAAGAEYWVLIVGTDRWRMQVRLGFW